jgi:saccharopine dehydrogenase-like NADP-dependent oxidoreductase
MGKKILVLGTGAQGTTVAQRMNGEENVEKIILADYDKKAVDELSKLLEKTEGYKVDASNLEDIIKIAEGVDLVVNALPLAFGKNAIEAALKIKANYQDFAAPERLVPEEEGKDRWIEGIKYMLNEYSKKFKEIDKLAITGTGSAPGLICAASKRSMRFVDSCDKLYNICYEGVETNRFQPYWWSPITALSDMEEDAYAFVDGKIVRRKPFSYPIYRKYDYMPKEIEFVEHCHDEPVYYGLHADSDFKGLKEAYFKYGGVGVEFARGLYAAGLLSHDNEEFNGAMVNPFNFVLAHIPAPPKFREEIKAIIDEGIKTDDGAMVVETYGKKNGKNIKIETHVGAPGLAESFAKSGITAEMFITGQGGALFTKLFANDDYEQKGMISSDMLTQKEIDKYFKYAEKLGITLEDIIVEGEINT